jgi:hypothetical protein
MPKMRYIYAEKYMFKFFALVGILCLLGFPQAGFGQFSTSSCLPQYDMRLAVKDKKAVPATQVISEAKKHIKGEVVNIQLCPESTGELTYYVVILEAGTKVRWVQFHAPTGRVVQVK